VGGSQPFADQQGETVGVLTVSSAVLSPLADEQLVQATVQLMNTGGRTIPMPALSASFQTEHTGFSVESINSASHKAYLAQGEKANYLFHAILPKGIDGQELQLALYETRNITTSASAPAEASGVRIPVLV